MEIQLKKKMRLIADSYNNWYLTGENDKGDRVRISGYYRNPKSLLENHSVRELGKCNAKTIKEFSDEVDRLIQATAEIADGIRGYYEH